MSGMDQYMVEGWRARSSSIYLLLCVPQHCRSARGIKVGVGVGLQRDGELLSLRCQPPAESVIARNGRRSHSYQQMLDALVHSKADCNCDCCDERVDVLPDESLCARRECDTVKRIIALYPLSTSVPGTTRRRPAITRPC